MKMANLLLTLLVLCFVVCVSGCNTAPEGFVQDVRPGRTSYDVKARTYRTVNMNGQMAWDDFDHLWMIDRPSRLNWLRVQQDVMP